MGKYPPNIRCLPCQGQNARWEISQGGHRLCSAAESRTFCRRVRNICLILLLLILAGGLGNGPATASVAEPAAANAPPESPTLTASRDNHWPAHWIGVEVERIPPVYSSLLGLLQNQGLLVIGVVASSPAGKAGLQPGDLLYELNGRPLRLPVQLIHAANAHDGNKAAPCKLTFIRQGRPTTVVITPRPRPALPIVQPARELADAIATPQAAMRTNSPSNLGRMVPGPGILVRLGGNTAQGEALPRFFSVTRWTQKNGQMQTMQIATRGKIYDVDMAHLEKLPPQIAMLAKIFSRLHQNALPAQAMVGRPLRPLNNALLMRQSVKQLTVPEIERLNLVRRIALLNAQIRNLTAVRNELTEKKEPLRSAEPPTATMPESGQDRGFECKIIDAQIAGLTAQRACLSKYLVTFIAKKPLIHPK